MLRQFHQANVNDLSTQFISENTISRNRLGGCGYSPRAAQSRFAVYVNYSSNIETDIVLVRYMLDWSEMTVLVRDLGSHLIAAHSPWIYEPDNPAFCSNGSAVPDPGRNPGLVRDCQTLLAMERTLAGDAPLYWSVNVPITEWLGITLGGSPLRVHAIEPVLGVKLNGTIPSEMSDLTQLRRLDLRGNALSGNIPPELGSLATWSTWICQNSGSTVAPSRGISRRNWEISNG